VLSIAGSDSGGGAGIQADLKTFCAFGAYGMTAVTAITAQNTVEVRGVEEVEPEMVAAQIAAVLDDIGADAVKIGMLASARIVAAVADTLDAYPPMPLVLDPVMLSKSGARLLSKEAESVLRERLLPRATLVTPNLPEAAALLGRSESELGDEKERYAAAQELGGIAAAALVKGGHGEGDEILDLLYDGERFHRYVHRRVPTRATHGTGCTLSSAIAAGLASGWSLGHAVGAAIEYLEGALRAAVPLGRGHGPVDHLFGLRKLLR
jgi:hydroxymethylpyrimidine/phosphomethylpyrimidine kinase